MISAFAKAAQVFKKKEYINKAVKAADFILSKMFDEKGRLLHRYRDGEAAIYGNADDYAFFITSLLDLYETVFEAEYLSKAKKLNDDFINHFWDFDSGGFFFIPDYGEKLIVRQKEIYDGAVPSGNSVAMLNLLRISRITSESEYEVKADSINKIFSSQISRYPAGYSQFLAAVDFAAGPSKEIIISGDNYNSFLEYIFETYIPSKIILKISSPEDDVIQLAPYLTNYIPSDAKTKIYVCENYICNLPVDNVQDLEQVLQ
jgi:uncharacterized protein YyaL (SSP411 family)